VDRLSIGSSVERILDVGRGDGAPSLAHPVGKLQQGAKLRVGKESGPRAITWSTEGTSPSESFRAAAAWELTQ